MKYSFGPDRNPDFDQLATPVGSICLFCGELIGPDDSGFALVCAGYPDAVEHRECLLSSIIGSVAHVQKRCSCYVPGAEETDPPELTKRQAARLALELWEQEHKHNG